MASRRTQLSLNLAGCTAARQRLATRRTVFSEIRAEAPSTIAIALNTFGTSNNGLGKIDYHINDHNPLNGEFFWWRRRFPECRRT